MLTITMGYASLTGAEGFVKQARNDENQTTTKTTMMMMMMREMEEEEAEKNSEGRRPRREMTGNIWSTRVREGHSRAPTIKPQLNAPGSRSFLLLASGLGEIYNKVGLEKAVPWRRRWDLALTLGTEGAVLSSGLRK